MWPSVIAIFAVVIAAEVLVTFIRSRII